MTQPMRTPMPEVGIDEVLTMAVPGKHVKLTLETDGRVYDLGGMVQDVSIMSEYDGMMSTTFTIVGYENGESFESSGKSFTLSDGPPPEIFIPDPPELQKWICIYCSTENPPEGDDGACIRCGGPKGESVKE